MHPIVHLLLGKQPDALDVYITLTGEFGEPTDRAEAYRIAAAMAEVYAARESSTVTGVEDIRMDPGAGRRHWLDLAERWTAISDELSLDYGPTVVEFREPEWGPTW